MNKTKNKITIFALALPGMIASVIVITKLLITQGVDQGTGMLIGMIFQLPILSAIETTLNSLIKVSEEEFQQTESYKQSRVQKIINQAYMQGYNDGTKSLEEPPFFDDKKEEDTNFYDGQINNPI